MRQRTTVTRQPAAQAVASIGIEYQRNSLGYELHYITIDGTFQYLKILTCAHNQNIT